MYDILRETKAFQDIMKYGYQEAQQEQLQANRKTLENIVQGRFKDAKTTRLAMGQAALITDPAILQDVIVKVSLAQTSEEARQALPDWPMPDGESNQDQ